MPRYMIVTSLFLFWAFFEMSGGTDFEPPLRDVVADADNADPIFEDYAAPVTVAVTVPEPALEAVLVMASYEDEPLAISSVVSDVALETMASPAFIAPQATDVRLVSGDWVNMRDGPSTQYQVLETLPRGTEAEVIDVNGDGWAQIRLIGSGKTGWMAERLLSAD